MKPVSPPPSRRASSALFPTSPQSDVRTCGPSHPVRGAQPGRVAAGWWAGQAHSWRRTIPRRSCRTRWRTWPACCSAPRASTTSPSRSPSWPPARCRRLPRARSLDIAAVHSSLLLVGEQCRGALNVDTPTPYAFTSHDLETMAALTRHTTAGFAGALRGSQDLTLTDHLLAALNSRQVIDHAIGARNVRLRGRGGAGPGRGPTTPARGRKLRLPHPQLGGCPARVRGVVEAGQPARLPRQAPGAKWGAALQ